MRYMKSLFTTYWICLSQTFLVAPLVVLTSQILRRPSFHYLDCKRYRVKTSHVTHVEQLLICSLIPRLSPPPKSLGMRLLPVHFDDERLWFLPYSLFRQWTQELAILHDLAVCKWHKNKEGWFVPSHHPVLDWITSHLSLHNSLLGKCLAPKCLQRRLGMRLCLPSVCHLLQRWRLLWQTLHYSNALSAFE